MAIMSRHPNGLRALLMFIVRLCFRIPGSEIGQPNRHWQATLESDTTPFA
jgi:hypothetical protein